jgi:hypothetical protein
MAAYLRFAGVAALFVFAAFVTHLLNSYYFEPQMGFKSLADYMSADKLRAALRAPSWTWSGYGHIATGIALVAIGSIVRTWAASRRPVSSLLQVILAALAGFAFIWVGIVDLAGSDFLGAYDAANPGHATETMLSAALLRNVALLVALVLLGLFLVTVTVCLRGLGKLPFWPGLLGYAAGLACLWTLRNPVAVSIAYVLIPIWALWVGIILYRDSQSLANFEERYI